MSESIKLSNYLTDKLIFTQDQYANSGELFQAVYDVALVEGRVREDFLTRVKEREATFPTGIQLENLGVAIPHTDAECVLEEFVAVVVNREPVAFQSMEDINVTVLARLVFVLGLNQPHAQLEMLQSLMGLLQNEELLKEILAATSSDDVITIVNKNNL
ncbi:PTS sugar transporter subunit IIA [Streptococcus ovis]|uniref:PTS sugar transporter subunit IIA n=1 Tax=Streptococcus ovis TaxID=82806 RepID=UPI0003673C4D|nr:PTS sugar transporter subunit IIA [Streptococcus ovis]